VHTKPTDATAAKTAINFFDWAFTNGDKAADDLDYVALPLAVKNKIRADWKKLALH
jgi:phosphate transport system substrate-binding protein